MRRKESTVEAGQSMIGDRSKSQFRELWLLREPFSIFSKCLFSLDASKQCYNRLGVGLSSRLKQQPCVVEEKCTHQYQTNRLQANPLLYSIYLQHRLLQHLLCGDFAIASFLFSTVSSFKFITLHRSLSSKLVSTVLPNNPRL
jgi:hypothetical protein